MVTRASAWLLGLFSVSLAVVGPHLLAQTDGPCASPGAACAPTGFTNETNGFEAQADFDEDRAAFDETEEVVRDTAKGQKGGLGPVYNATSCGACHQNAGFVIKGLALRASGAVSGTSSQVAEIRAGHNERTNSGDILFREAPGGSVIQQRAIDPKVQEHVPDLEDIRTLRFATSVLGDGFVECIRDEDILRVRDGQPPDVRGRAVAVPVVVEAVISNGKVDDFVFSARIGRFGWKSQEASLLNFAAGAYAAEMGITSELQRVENSSLGRSVDDFDVVPDPEDAAVLTPDKPGDAGFKPHPFGEDVEAFTRFMRSTMAPPQAAPIEPTNVRRGKEIFTQIGCATCHHPEFTTAAEGTQFGDVKVPTALASKRIFPYSDFLLHDIGTGDGIVQTQYAEYPPTGLTVRATASALSTPGGSSTERTVTATLDLDRLNALLRGESDPKYPSRQVNDLRRAGNVPPAIQVRDPAQVTSSRVNRRAVLSPETDERIQTSRLFTTETAQLIRTAPLWGLRTRPQVLHDGRALTLLDAIQAHRKQAKRARTRFERLSRAEKRLVLDFLNFL